MDPAPGVGTQRLGLVIRVLSWELPLVDEAVAESGTVCPLNGDHDRRLRNQADLRPRRRHRRSHTPRLRRHLPNTLLRPVDLLTRAPLGG